MPFLRSTCQSYLISWPALGTSASVRRAYKDAVVESVSGGRFFTGSGAASSPPLGRCPNGRYHTSSGLAASESPTNSASWGSWPELSTSIPTSGAARRRSTSAGKSSGSSITVTSVAEGPDKSESVSQESADRSSSGDSPSPESSGGEEGTSTGTAASVSRRTRE